MGGASIWHWVLVGGVVMLLFGRGKISDMMGDVAKGIKAFKKGMSDDEPVASGPATTVPTNDPIRTIEGRPVDPAATSSTLADRKIG